MARCENTALVGEDERVEVATSNNGHLFLFFEISRDLSGFAFVGAETSAQLANLASSPGEQRAVAVDHGGVVGAAGDFAGADVLVVKELDQGRAVP